MKKRHFLLTCWLFICIFCGFVYSSNTNWVVKKNEFRFGADEDGYTAICDLELYEDKIIMVENFTGNRLLKFTKNGDLVKSMGKRGKEPGEFSNPIEMSIWENEIAVKDDAGLTIYNVDGSFIRHFNPFVSIVSFVYTNDKIYILTAVPDKESLIDVFSPEGDFVNEMGEGLFKLDYSNYKSMSPIRAKSSIYSGTLLSDGESLYYLNSKFGNVLVFSLTGEKIAEYNMASALGEDGQKIVQANKRRWFEEGIDLKKTKGRIPAGTLFHDACLSGDKIYLLRWKPINLEEGYKTENDITVLDVNTMQAIDFYKVKKADDEIVLALFVEDDENKPVFHFTMGVKDKASIYAEYRRE